MFYSVSYSAYVCDDGVAETVTRTFDSVFDAIDYWADCSETESDCVISQVELNEDDDDLPF